MVFVAQIDAASRAALQLIIGEEKLILAVDPEHDGSGVYAYGSNDAVVRETLRQGGAMKVRVGAARVTTAPLSQAMAEKFVSACRDLADNQQ
jgi:hypothetical protein